MTATEAKALSDRATAGPGDILTAFRDTIRSIAAAGGRGLLVAKVTLAFPATADEREAALAQLERDGFAVDRQAGTINWR